jgi:hypothetical protein
MTPEQIKTICDCINHVSDNIGITLTFCIIAYSICKMFGGGFEK